MPVIGYILAVLVSYLLGSVPTGFLVSKARGIDIRTVGSGNIGATNVFRHLGTPAGALVLGIDALKGYLAVAVAASLLADEFYPGAGLMAREWFRILAGLGALLGHNYTCWLYFKGGKGIATSAGVLTALVPYALLIILAVWIIVFTLTRYVSLGSICAASALPVAAWLTGSSLRLILITAAMTLLAIYKHRANIRRLVQGTESRIGRKAAASSTTPSQ